MNQQIGMFIIHLGQFILFTSIIIYLWSVIMLKDFLIVTLNLDSVVNQYPDMIVKCDYLSTDTFDSGLEYGPDTIRKEPPLNRIFYRFPQGADIKYLGNNQWEISAPKNKPKAMTEALRLITPVGSNQVS